MNASILKFCAIAFAVVAISACDKLPRIGSSGTAVIDLAEIAQATGQETLIQEKAQAARDDLNQRLANTAEKFEAQLLEEREKLGESPNEEQQQQFQQLAGRAQQQYAQQQQQAQQQAQQFEANLVMQLREKIQPVVAEIARAQGVNVVYLADLTLFWNEPDADLTDEVIAKLTADPSILADEPAADAAQSAAEQEAVPEAEDDLADIE